MQHLISNASLARLFSASRSSAAVLLISALTIAATTGLALSAIWLGAALLVQEVCTTLAAAAPARRSTLVQNTITFTNASALAAAPAIVWASNVQHANVAAISLIVACGAHVLLASPRSILVKCAPLAAVLSFAVVSGGQWALAAATLAIAYLFSQLYAQVQRGEHNRAQDADWVRQLNMFNGEATRAAWEIDFASRSITGAASLANVLRRPVTFDDIVNGACFAAAADRALAHSLFNPQPGPSHRVSFEHDAVQLDGSLLRVRHQAYMRANLDGSPDRLFCVSQPSLEACADKDAQSLHRVLARTETMLKAQAQALAVLSNELGVTAQDAPVQHAPENDSNDLGARLLHHIDLLDGRRQAISDRINDLVRNHHEAESANFAKSQFLASMSHELRTPLNAIIGYAEMLHEDAEDSGNSNAARDLSRILTAARHLLGLLNEILDLSKIEAGRTEVAEEPFSILGLLENVATTMRPLAIQNGNQLDVSYTGDAIAASTDETKLQQCVLNLVSNACKFTKDGKVSISGYIRSHNGVEQLFVAVTDNGIGISGEHTGRLFQPFVQATPSITREYGGTGLGLTITRRLAQLLGGDVSVASTLGEGSTFTVHVPLRFSDAPAARGAAAAIDAVQGDTEAPLVLVIEDEADARELAARSLTRAGFSVQGAGGGKAGLALAKEKAPALILLDIFLPDRSGWRVLQSLKHDPNTREIPVIVLSVNEDRAHALALGAAEHLVKPADRDVLAATVMRFARLRPSLAADAASTPAARKVQ